MDHAKIGARIRAARKALKLTQEEVEERCGISQATLSKIETGRAPLSLANAVALAKICKLPLEKLTARAA